MASNLFRGQRTIRIWTPLKTFGLLWQLSYEVWNSNFRISRAQSATFGTKFRVNWCPICTSRCQNVLRNAFRTQASRQIIDIMVVFVFSVRFIAYEFTLDERRLLIRQCSAIQKWQKLKTSKKHSKNLFANNFEMLPFMDPKLRFLFGSCYCSNIRAWKRNATRAFWAEVLQRLIELWNSSTKQVWKLF